jgi:peptide chain release factor 1
MPSSSSMSSSRSTARWGFGGAFSLSIETLTDRPGYLAFRCTGKDAERAFAHEAGGHRWQRVPPNEKRGRVHTSTVTVAVLREPTATEVHLHDRDLDIRTTRSGGPGGQHANKTDSAVIITHKPTGISVRVETKSQHRNKELAMGILRARLHDAEHLRLSANRNARRRAQVGCGARGDKRRTIAVQRGTVNDHVTGKSMRVKGYLRGDITELWPG